MIGGNAKVTQDCLPFVVTDGFPARARAVNVVGLRRAGVGAATIRALKEAYRTLLRSGLPLAEAVQRLEASPSRWCASWPSSRAPRPAASASGLRGRGRGRRRLIQRTASGLRTSRTICPGRLDRPHALPKT